MLNIKEYMRDDRVRFALGFMGGSICMAAALAGVALWRRKVDRNWTKCAHVNPTRGASQLRQPVVETEFKVESGSDAASSDSIPSSHVRALTDGYLNKRVQSNISA